MNTLWKTLGRSLLLISQSKNGQQSLRRGETFEDNGRSGRPKDATADETVRVAHTPWLCVIESETCEA